MQSDGLNASGTLANQETLTRESSYRDDVSKSNNASPQNNKKCTEQFEHSSAHKENPPNCKQGTLILTMAERQGQRIMKEEIINTGLRTVTDCKNTRLKEDIFMGMTIRTLENLCRKILQKRREPPRG